jgi:N-acetylmuramoyl-L-alanine amidase
MTDDEEIDIVARTLFGEARGEGQQGMVAVACVIVTRAMIADRYVEVHQKPHPLFGDGSLASVCQAHFDGIYQFSTWNVGDPNRAIIEAVTGSDPSFLVALGIATDAENDELDDITNMATHYYAKGSPMPAWAQGKTPCFECGKHLFFNDIS